MANHLLLKRNEDTSQYFEKVFAALEFAKLLKADSGISRIEIKPDRKDGAKRRIEDITKFNEDESIEVIQLKYSDDPSSKWVYSDLWKKRSTIQNSEQKNNRYEGTSIFKFLKTWRFHKGRQRTVRLFLISNKPLGNDLKAFYSDIKKLRESKINWEIFSTKYDDELKNIKINFSNSRLRRGELEAFIKSLEFKSSKEIIHLDAALSKELRTCGVFDKDRVDAFITRTFRRFTQSNITVRRADAEELLEIIKSSLIHEIDTPKNYVQRRDLEKEILAAVEGQKKEGGFVFLFAPSGSGKTILLSELTRKNEDFIPYLCRIRPFGKINSDFNYPKERLSNKWFKADLIQRFFELGLIKETVSIRDSEDSINLVFGRTLKELSESALKRRNKKIVIIIDALDQIETDSYQGKSILNAIPHAKYPGVVFLLSTWGEKYIPSQISGKKISVSLSFTEAEIKEYFVIAKIQLTSDQINKIFRKTKGLAISLFYLAQKLKRLSKNDYDGAIDAQYKYADVFDWYEPIWLSLNKQQKHYLGCLSFHYTEVQKDRLYKIAKIGLSNFSILTERISPFVNLKGGYIEPYHDSFRRFIVSKLKDFRKEYHKEIIKFYANPNHFKLPYAKKYLTTHLATVGLSDPLVTRISNKLVQKKFIEEILASRLDYASKANATRYFVKYFNTKNDLENFIKYAILISNVSPLVDDDDIFLKGRIGTANLLKEVEDDLATVQNASIHSLRKWIFKRIRMGNLLKQNGDALSESIANRLIEDGLARISFNKEILWSSDISGESYWEYLREYLEAQVNLGRYRSAAQYLVDIRFKESKPSTVGFRASMLVELNRIGYSTDKKFILDLLKKLSPSLQLITYGYLYIEQKNLVAAAKLRPLLKKPTLYRYLIDDEDESQSLDLAEAVFMLKIKESKASIRKLVRNLKFTLPYHSDMYSFWGLNDKNFFLRKAALLSLVESAFDEKVYYVDLLKQDKKGRFEDYNNDAFTSIVAINILLAKNLLLIKSNSLTWKQFRDFLRSNLKIFKSEIIKADEFYQLREYPLRDSSYIYYENINSFLGDSLQVVAKYFPKNLESFVLEVEALFEGTVLQESPAYSEIILEQLLPLTPALKRKIEDYEKKVLDNKTREKLDNIEKSDELKTLARVMTDKGYTELAEDIYRRSLKYSRGLWAREDLRIFNLIDCLRTRTKPEEFNVILAHIDKIGEALQGSWYYKLTFLESVTYANYELALDYFVELANIGEINLNDGLTKVILTSLDRYPYKDIIPQLLPLLDIIRFDEETDYSEQKNFQAIYYAIIDHSLRNDRALLAKDLFNKYFVYLKRYVYVRDRLRLLDELLSFIKERPMFKAELKNLIAYIKQLKKDGYSAESGESKYAIISDSQLTRAKFFAKERSVKKIIALLDGFIKNDQQYKVEELISKILPSLNTQAISTIRNWCVNNKVEFLTYPILIALLEFSIQNANKEYFKQTKRDILAYCKNSEQLYGMDEVVNKLDDLEFDGKRKFIKQLIRCSIERTSGSSYHLNSFLLRTSDVIDKYSPELKKFAFEPLKEVVENSMRLSLSKS